MTTENLYPECEKLAAIHDEAMTIRNFLQQCEEEGINLVSQHSGNSMSFVFEEKREQLIMSFFDIDTDKLEQERQEIIASLG